MSLSRAIERLIEEIGEDSAVNVSSLSAQPADNISDLASEPSSGALLPRGGAADDDSYASLLPGADDPMVAFTKLEGIYTEKLRERESELARLKASSAERELQLHESLRRKEGEVAQLKAALEGDVRSLMERQAQLEAQAPALKSQMETARRQLSDVHVSEAMYHELLRTPEERRPLADEVKIRVFEALRPLRTENESLRGQTSAAVETAQRCAEDAEKLRRDNERLQAVCGARERDAADMVEGQRCRMERLERDLEDALVRGEVLGAKGTLYDELKAKCDVFEAEAMRARALDATVSALRAELETLRGSLRDKDARTAALMLDKAHLCKQGELLEQQVERLARDLEARDTRIRELKAQRQQLYDKLLDDERSLKEKSEARILQEVERMRRDSSTEIAKIRQEARDAADREVFHLREMRDSALIEQERIRGQLRDSEAAHDQILDQLRDLQRKSDVRITELQAALGIKSLELEHVRASLGERTEQGRGLDAECQLLRDKCRVLGESFHALENEKNRKVAELEERLAMTREQLEHYELIENNLDEAILNTGRLIGPEPELVDLSDPSAETAPATVLHALEGVVPLAARRRIKQALALAGRCARLEAERSTFVQDKEAAEARARTHLVEIAVLKQKLQLIPQPQSILLQSLEAAERRAAEAEARAAELSGALQAAEERARMLRADLAQVLAERRQLAEVQQTLLAANEGEVAAAYMGGVRGSALRSAPVNVPAVGTSKPPSPLLGPQVGPQGHAPPSRANSAMSAARARALGVGGSAGPSPGARPAGNARNGGSGTAGGHVQETRAPGQDQAQERGQGHGALAPQPALSSLNFGTVRIEGTGARR